MKCPFCNAEDTRVIDSRPADENTAIRRRRQCEICGNRFTTFEKTETLPFMVVKKDQSRVPYDRAKLEGGILRSCHKRPISPQQISELVDDIENNIFKHDSKEVSTEEIGEMVMERLRNLDQVAYVRFASVYREFKDINTFMEEIGKLLTSRSKGDEKI